MLFTKHNFKNMFSTYNFSWMLPFKVFVSVMFSEYLFAANFEILRKE